MEGFKFDQAPMENADEKKSRFEKVKDAARIAAFSALAAVGANEATAGQDVEQNYDELKQKWEEVVGQAQEAQNMIVDFVDTKGVEGSFDVVGPEGPGSTPTKTMETPNGRVTLGYDDAGNVAWMSYDRPDGSATYFDAGVDGVVDRVVTNGSEKDAGQKSMENYMKMLTPSLDDLAEEAQTEAELLPENVQMFQINYNEEGDPYAAQMVDFQTGDAVEIEDEAAFKTAVNGQEMFSNYLSDLHKGNE